MGSSTAFVLNIYMKLSPFSKKEKIIKFGRPPSATGVPFKKSFLEKSMNIAASEFPITGLEDFFISLMISLPKKLLLCRVKLLYQLWD